eukprot:3207650-Amphidinium_carterae.1
MISAYYGDKNYYIHNGIFVSDLFEKLQHNGHSTEFCWSYSRVGAEASETTLAGVLASLARCAGVEPA